jgi:hypothetical protein
MPSAAFMPLLNGLMQRDMAAPTHVAVRVLLELAVNGRSKSGEATLRPKVGFALSGQQNLFTYLGLFGMVGLFATSRP